MGAIPSLSAAGRLLQGAPALMAPLRSQVPAASMRNAGLALLPFHLAQPAYEDRIDEVDAELSTRTLQVGQRERVMLASVEAVQHLVKERFTRSGDIKQCHARAQLQVVG